MELASNSGGIPNQLASRTSRVTRLNPASVPLTYEAVAAEYWTRLTRYSCFGRDPLAEHVSLQRLRDRDFGIRYPDLQVVFTELLHGSPHLFKSAVTYHIQLTRFFGLLL